MPEYIPPPRTSGFTGTTTSPLYWCAYGPAAAEKLLVLHGGPGAHHDYLLPQMLHLAKRYNVIFYDQRGGGKSKHDDREHVTWKTHVMDLHAVIRELHISSLSLVAYSFGGMLALLYAIEAKKHDSYLEVNVQNPFDPETSQPLKGTGFGLVSIQRRLFLLFARNDLLKTQKEDDHFITTILIPQTS